MNIAIAALLGFVEGLTEFLPISSTFHLLLTTRVLGLPETNFSKFFDVFIQAGAILPVLVLFWKDWLYDRKLLMKIGVAFVPTAIVGFVLHKVIKEVLFDATGAMVITFVAVAVVFLVVEWLVEKGRLKLSHKLADMTWLDAGLIGLAQALAVMPGVSRAGGVIVAMMLLRYRRDEAGKFSFMLAVPTIIGASALDLLKERRELMGLGTVNILPLAVGFVVAFFTSLLVIRWFVSYLRKQTLVPFAVYRIVVGVSLAAWLFILVR